MPAPPIQRLRRSSRSWPPVILESRGAPRLAALWVTWCLGLACALGAGCDLPAPARAALVLTALGALWGGFRALLAPGGAGDIRLSWEADGRWRLLTAAGAATYVEAGAPRRLGPLIWVCWRHAGRRRYLLLDGTGMEPARLAMLKARMKVSSVVRQNQP